MSATHAEPFAPRFGEMMEELSKRQVFAGSARAATKRAGITAFNVVWHRNRNVQLVLDERSRTVLASGLLPGLARTSQIYKDLGAFLKEFAAPERPEHRRVDPEKAYLKSSLKGGVVQIEAHSVDGDYEYALLKLVQVINEVFIIFITPGEYFAYRVEHLGAHPDWGA